MKVWHFLVVVIVAMQLAYADDSSPYRSTLSGIGSREAASLLRQTLSTTVRTEGRVSLRFTRQRVAKWKATTSRMSSEEVDRQRVILLQGEATIRGIVYPAAGTVVDGHIRITFPGRERGSRGSRQRIYTLSISPSLKEDKIARVSAVPSAVFGDKSCGDAGVELTAGARGPTVKRLSAASTGDRTYRVVTIGTVADAELYKRHGVNTNAFVAGLINSAEVLYERQLGIRFEIVRQYAYAEATNPALNQTEPGSLLTAFAKSGENASILGMSAQTFDQDVDVKYLFSGKDLDGTTVGMAYIGAVCFQPQSAYGLIQSTSPAAAPYYFAHELGHNLGARHDTQAWWGMSIMSPMVSIGSTFSQLSITQINEFLTAFGSCLEEKVMPPNLANAVLTLGQVREQGRLRLKGRLISPSNEPISGESIRLAVGSRMIRLRTDKNGAYSRLMRRGEISGPTKAVASTQGGEVKSRTLSLRPF